MREFFLALTCTLRGVIRLISSPRLWAVAWLPVVVSAVLLAASIWIAVSWFTANRGEIPWVGEVGGVALDILVALVGIAVGGLAFSFVARVLAAPLLALFADRVVADVSGAPAPAGPGGPFVRWGVRPVTDALLLLALRLAVTLPALLLFLVPVAGPVLFAALMLPLAGLDLLDLALSARGVTIGRRLRWAREHLGACFGLGAGAAAVLAVPCVNLLLLPALVIAAVLADAAISPDFPRRSVVPA